MKHLTSLSLLKVASAAFFFACTPVMAQWQVPDHSVPIGRGAGTGFKNAVPGAAGGVLTSNGATSDPSFQSIAGAFGTQTANTIFSGPTSGGAAAPTFRALVGADLPNPGASSLGGVQSKTCSSSNWFNTLSTSGVLGCTQPSFSDITGQTTLAQLPTIASGTVLANATAGSATPTASTATSWLDRWCTTLTGYGPIRNSVAWGCSKLTNPNPQWWGVTCDGSTDDTSAINTALTANAGGKLFFPSGVCKTSGGHSITTTGTYIECAGAESTKFLVTSSTADVFTFSGVIGGGIRGCSFTPSGTRTAGSFVQINNSYLIWILQNNFNQGFYGVSRDANTSPAWIESNQFTVAAGGSGIRLTGGTGSVVIMSNLIQGNNATPPRSGVNLVSASGVWMSNNDAYQCGDGLLIEPGNGQSVEHIFGTGNAWDSGTQNGINIVPSGTGIVQRLRFTNEWSASNAKKGIVIQGAGTIRGFSFVNGFLYTNGEQGIAVAAGTNVDISHSVVSGNSAASSGALDGINIQPNISDFRIIGNRSGADDGFSNTQRNGIRVEVGTSDNFVIAMNDVRTNSVAGLVDNSTGSAGRVMDNVGYNPVGVTAAASTGTTGATITAGHSPETHYVRQSATFNAAITIGGNAICTVPSANAPCVVQLGPNESYAVAWSTTQPTYTKYVH